MSQEAKRRRIAALLADYIAAVKGQSIALPADDFNVLAHRESKAVRTLLSEFADEGREALSQYFEHPNPQVRLSTAVWLLRYKHAEAMKILREIKATAKGLLQFGAEQSIKNWYSGDWQLDPAPENDARPRKKKPSSKQRKRRDEQE